MERDLADIVNWDGYDVSFLYSGLGSEGGYSPQSPSPTYFGINNNKKNASNPTRLNNNNNDISTSDSTMGSGALGVPPRPVGSAGKEKSERNSGTNTNNSVNRNGNGQKGGAAPTGRPASQAEGKATVPSPVKARPATTTGVAAQKDAKRSSGASGHGESPKAKIPSKPSGKPQPTATELHFAPMPKLSTSAQSNCANSTSTRTTTTAPYIPSTAPPSPPKPQRNSNSSNNGNDNGNGLTYQPLDFCPMPPVTRSLSLSQNSDSISPVSRKIGGMGRATDGCATDSRNINSDGNAAAAEQQPLPPPNMPGIQSNYSAPPAPPAQIRPFPVTPAAFFAMNPSDKEEGNQQGKQKQEGKGGNPNTSKSDSSSSNDNNGFRQRVATAGNSSNDGSNRAAAFPPPPPQPPQPLQQQQAYYNDYNNYYGGASHDGEEERAHAGGAPLDTDAHVPSWLQTVNKDLMGSNPNLASTIANTSSLPLQPQHVEGSMMAITEQNTYSSSEAVFLSAATDGDAEGKLERDWLNPCTRPRDGAYNVPVRHNAMRGKGTKQTSGGGGQGEEEEELVSDTYYYRKANNHKSTSNGGGGGGRSEPNNAQRREPEEQATAQATAAAPYTSHGGGYAPAYQPQPRKNSSSTNSNHNISRDGGFGSTVSSGLGDPDGFVSIKQSQHTMVPPSQRGSYLSASSGGGMSIPASHSMGSVRTRSGNSSHYAGNAFAPQPSSFSPPRAVTTPRNHGSHSPSGTAGASTSTDMGPPRRPNETNFFYNVATQQGRGKGVAGTPEGDGHPHANGAATERLMPNRTAAMNGHCPDNLSATASNNGYLSTDGHDPLVRRLSDGRAPYQEPGSSQNKSGGGDGATGLSVSRISGISLPAETLFVPYGSL